MDGTGGYGVAPLSPGWHTIAVDGVDGVPISGVTAVVVVITAIAPSGVGEIEADADGVATPNTSTYYLSYSSSSATSFANTAVIPVGADGAVQLNPTATTDLTVDLEGYYTGAVTGAESYYPIQDATVANTVDGTGGIPESQVGAGGTLAVQIGGVAGIPADAIGAAVGVHESNATAGAGGTLTVTPHSSAGPSPEFDWPGSEPDSWTVTTQLSTTGQIDINVTSGGPIDISVVVEGYYLPATASQGAFMSVANRVFDSAASSATLDAGSSETVQIGGVNDIPATGSGIDAVLVNVSVTSGATTGGQLQLVGDDGTAGASQINFDTVTGSASGFVIVPLGADGGIGITNESSSNVNYVVDVEGWLSGDGGATISCPTPYEDGSWTQAPPSTTMSCQVVAPPAPSGGGSVSIALDGTAVTATAVSPTTATTTTVTVASGGGGHTITASMYSDSVGPSTDSSYGWGAGQWSAVSLVADIANGADTDDLSPSLGVGTSGAPLPDGTTVKYALSANSDGSDPILTSGWSQDVYNIPDGALTVGTTYYWQAQVSGPNNFDGTAVNMVSPWWSFVYTDSASLSGETSGFNATSAPVGASRCGKVTLVTVRGTGATAGAANPSSGDPYVYKVGAESGTPGDAEGYGSKGSPEFNLVVEARTTISRYKVYTEALRYPATASVGKYSLGNSLAAGETALVGELNDLAYHCPSTIIWLSGHSQGAWVIDGALLLHHSAIHSAALANLRGVVLAGDPTYWPREQIDASGDGGSHGAAVDGGFLDLWPLPSWRPQYSLDSFTAANASGTRVTLIRSYCAAGDFFCQNNLGDSNYKIHSGYGVYAWTSRMLPFLESFVP